jgi:hypothetical protein
VFDIASYDQTFAILHWTFLSAIYFVKLKSCYLKIVSAKFIKMGVLKSASVHYLALCDEVGVWHTTYVL